MMEHIQKLQEKQEMLYAIIQEQQSRIEALEKCPNLPEYFSVASYTTLRDIDFLDIHLAEKIEERCIALSKEQDVYIGEREKDSNVYHLDILFQAFDELFFTQQA